MVGAAPAWACERRRVTRSETRHAGAAGALPAVGRRRRRRRGAHGAAGLRGLARRGRRRHGRHSGYVRRGAAGGRHQPHHGGAVRRGGALVALFQPQSRCSGRGAQPPHLQQHPPRLRHVKQKSNILLAYRERGRRFLLCRCLRTFFGYSIA